ncbi:MAG TPA: hypothetical protein VJN95_16605 [Gemmatimonadales bacterium]|nr:hypothetical protein [Gemmatimonadales bacterium]
MACRRLLAFLLLLILAGPAAAQGVPDSLLVSALVSRTGGGGGCFGDLDTASATIRFFPGVHFLRARCTLEHGDPFSAIVAGDSSGVLYLFGDETGLDFLLDRHGPKRIRAEDRLAFAGVLLELSGKITSRAVFLDSLGQVPVVGRKPLGAMATHLAPQSVGDSIHWGVTLTTSTLDFRAERIEQWDVQGIPPRAWSDTLKTWYGPPITRFAVPRERPDSLLAQAARNLGRDYGAAYAGAVLLQKEGLAALFDLTASLADSAAALHTNSLFELLVLWRDGPFFKVLRSRPAGIQRAVCQRMIGAFSPQEHWEKGFPSLVSLAQSLGIRISD